jgi:hypothetical protein
MVKQIPGRRRATLGADDQYDCQEFVDCLRTLHVTPHVAQKERTRDARTTRHSGYAASHRFRKRVEEVFGWLKTVGLSADGLTGTRARGLGVHLRGGRLQLSAAADASSGGGMRCG